MHGALKWGKRILSLWFIFVAWVHLLQKVFLKGIRRLLTQNIWIQFYNNTAHRIFNSYEMHQMYLIFIFLSAFVCLYFNVPLFHPLRTHKWSWIKFGNCLTLPVDSIPIPLLCQAVKNKLEAKLLVCQTLDTSRILTLIIDYIRVEILLFNRLSVKCVWQAKLERINWMLRKKLN